MIVFMALLAVAALVGFVGAALLWPHDGMH
jgi:hypothetical protein